VTKLKKKTPPDSKLSLFGTFFFEAEVMQKSGGKRRFFCKVDPMVLMSPDMPDFDYKCLFRSCGSN